MAPGKQLRQILTLYLPGIVRNTLQTSWYRHFVTAGWRGTTRNGPIVHFFRVGGYANIERTELKTAIRIV
ncbi:hypothetical protein ACG33_03710 [Steroidobacter denitrificans]|uniref:Transposase n=1 Tax=Steroidobacter denitrificans TaxID=465721 RepID=A0A127F708_STEDE|nr:hypothetical protein ACG33_03710 [Steroidobacter denitrificans]